MLSRLLFVRLKAAENALRDGRLDEAFRLAKAPDLREHRRGAAVLAKLTERLIERARNHYRSDRFTEALLDLDRAEAGGVMQEDIAELREHVRTVAAAQRSDEHSRRDRIDAAKRRVESGSLAAGRRILEDASSGDQAAKELRRAVDHRAEDAAAMASQAERLMSQGQLAEAARRILRAKGVDAHLEAVTRAEMRLCNLVFDNARAAVLEGKLSRASDELGCLGNLGEALPAKRELGNLLGVAGEAARCVGNGDYAEARRHALSLARLLPGARWLGEVVEQLRQIDEVRTMLCSGPLGDHLTAGAPDARPGALPVSLDDTVALPKRGPTSGSLPERLLLMVDGGGSYLLLRSGQVSLGRAASSDPADVPVFSDVAERHATINRVDDDYFLFSKKQVDVAGQRTTHQLLRDGDRIALGRRAKFTFRTPSRKSPTAVLDLSDTTKVPNDVRRVVLFHQHATVGAGQSAHIRCQHAGPSLVLFERSGALWLRQRNDGHVDTEAVELRLGEPVEIAGASLVLQPWAQHTHGARAT